MSPPADDPTHTALLSVISSLTATVEQQRAEAAEARAEAAKARAEAAKARAGSRRELAHLMSMLEGLTKQLDILLAGKHEDQRAEVAKQREAARKLAEALEKKLAEPSEGDNTEGTSADPQSADESASKPRSRDEHGRAPKPEHLERDTHKSRPSTCSTCGGERLLVGKTLVTEEYDYVRAHVRIRRTERTLCNCADCNAHLVPEQPPMPFDRAACTFHDGLAVLREVRLVPAA